MSRTARPGAPMRHALPFATREQLRRLQRELRVTRKTKKAEQCTPSPAVAGAQRT